MFRRMRLGFRRRRPIPAFDSQTKDKEIRMKRLLVAAGAVGWFGVLFAETCTWTGGSGKWSEESCCADARVLTAGDSLLGNGAGLLPILQRRAQGGRCLSRRPAGQAGAGSVGNGMSPEAGRLRFADG